MDESLTIVRFLTWRLYRTGGTPVPRRSVETERSSRFSGELRPGGSLAFLGMFA